MALSSFLHHLIRRLPHHVSSIGTSFSAHRYFPQKVTSITLIEKNELNSHNYRHLSIDSSPSPSALKDVEIRPVDYQDRENGLFEVLSQLTVAPQMSKEKFRKHVDMERRNGLKHTLVAVTKSGQVVGTGALNIETKLIRDGTPAGHIEDVVVAEEVRGAQVGRQIVEQLIQLGRAQGCYKVVLNCGDRNVVFYEKCGFAKMANMMGIYYE